MTHGLLSHQNYYRISNLHLHIPLFTGLNYLYIFWTRVKSTYACVSDFRSKWVDEASGDGRTITRVRVRLERRRVVMRWTRVGGGDWEETWAARYATSTRLASARVRWGWNTKSRQLACSLAAASLIINSGHHSSTCYEREKRSKASLSTVETIQHIY